MAKKKYSRSAIQDEISQASHSSYQWSRKASYRTARSMGASRRKSYSIAYGKAGHHLKSLLRRKK